MDNRGEARLWDRQAVEDGLVAAFRALPSHPVFSRNNRVRSFGQADAACAEPLNWTARFVSDRMEAVALLTWARCRAQGESASAQYDGLGWNRATAERARRRGAERIVAGLQAAPRRLDSETTHTGTFVSDETDVGLAPV